MNRLIFRFYFFVLISILKYSTSQTNTKSEYTEDEQNTSYNFYIKYNNPQIGEKYSVSGSKNDKQMSDKDFPVEGSFLSNVNLFNRTLTNYKVHMAVILGTPGFIEPSQMEFGRFTSKVDDEEDLVNYFNKNKQNYDKLTQEKLDITINDTVEKIKSIYIKNLSLITGTNTTEIVFISDNNDDHQVYTNKLINKFYENSKLETLYVKDKVFSQKNFDASVWNVEGKLPIASSLSAETSTTYFGYDIPNVCNKFSNWLQYGNKDKKLVTSYSTLYKKFHDVLVANYKTRDKFYTDTGSLLLDLSEENIRTNMTLGYILSNSLYANAVLFGISEMKNFLTSENIKDFLDMHNFLKYEYFLYSDLHSYMIISPFIEFAMKEFNLKLNNFKNATAYPQNARKIVWFTGYENNISSLFKVLNYDYLTKKYASLSLRETYQNDMKLKNNISYFPYVGYGYTVSLELLSQADPDTNKQIFYIGFRDNLKSDYFFVLSLRAFNKIAKLIMMVPPYSGFERQNFCK